MYSKLEHRLKRSWNQAVKITFGVPTLFFYFSLLWDLGNVTHCVSWSFSISKATIRFHQMTLQRSQTSITFCFAIFGKVEIIWKMMPFSVRCSWIVISFHVFFVIMFAWCKTWPILPHASSSSSSLYQYHSVKWNCMRRPFLLGKLKMWRSTAFLLCYLTWVESGKDNNFEQTNSNYYFFFKSLIS